MQTVQKLELILPILSLAELRQLNKSVVNSINSHMAIKQRLAMNTLRVGALAEFTNSKTGRRIRIRIEKLNSKTVSGREIHIPDGTPRMETWRVSPSLLSVVG
jgi:hypothetical protein